MDEPEYIEKFLSKHGWSIVQPVGQDGSARRYFRVEKSGQIAVLMDASGAPRQEMADFIRIGAWLREIGLRAPEIYEVDAAAGFLICEDFGDVSFKVAIGQASTVHKFYIIGAGVLGALQREGAVCPLALPDYFDSRIHQGHRRVVDYYVPAVLGRRHEDGLVEEYLAVWETIEKDLPSCRQGFVHGDFHVENLMWLADGDGVQRCGILDFQGAMHGPLAYDLVNLLEDARSDVPGDVTAEILSGYDEDFLLWYRVLGTQFHGRAIGQFIKLALEEGKMQYLEHIPRLEAYMRRNLEHPLLAPLQSFFSDLTLDFSGISDLNSERIRPFIREDAF